MRQTVLPYVQALRSCDNVLAICFVTKIVLPYLSVDPLPQLSSFSFHACFYMSKASLHFCLVVNGKDLSFVRQKRFQRPLLEKNFPLESNQQFEACSAHS